MTLHFNIISLKKRRRYLRSHLPKAEVLLWMHLSRRQMLGYKFRRQHSVDRFVVDFYCPELRLAIEVDGDSHFTPMARIYDRGRQTQIESFGISFLRVLNEDVYYNLDGVLDNIEGTIRAIGNSREQPPLSMDPLLCRRGSMESKPDLEPPITSRLHQERQTLPSFFEGGGTPVNR